MLDADKVKAIQDILDWLYTTVKENPVIPQYLKREFLHKIEELHTYIRYLIREL